MSFALTGQLRKSERSLLVERDWSIAAFVLWEVDKKYCAPSPIVDPR